MDHLNSQDENKIKAVAYFSLGNDLRKEGLFLKALRAFIKAKEMDEDIPEFHHNLAFTYKQLGQLDESIASYESAIEKNKTQPLLKAQSYLNLAGVYKQQHKKELAASCYQEAALLDESLEEEIAFMLAAIGIGEQTRAPASYIKRLFDQYAPTYDKHLIKKLHYRAPAHISKTLLEHMEQFEPKLELLDLVIDAGCGSGLCAHALRGLTKKLIGIDLSSKMLNQAKLSMLYDETIEEDLVIAFEKLAADHDAPKADAIVAADVFNYFGELNRLLFYAKKLLKQNGCLIFSIESCEQNHLYRDFYLKDTARFIHDLGFVKKALKEAGFANITEKKFILRYESEEPVWAYLIYAN